MMAPQVVHEPVACIAGAITAYPDGTLSEAFERRVDAAPGAPAVRFAGRTMLYRELEARANQVAAVLRARGVGEEDRVAVCLERGELLIAGLLGVLKAGAAYLPLDPASPRRHLQKVLDDAAPQAVITATSTGVTDLGLPVVLVDGPEARAATDARRGAAGTGRSLAYVIYTSGSTGSPMGVCIEHASVVNFCVQIGAEYDIGPGRRVLGLAPVTFDVSVFEVFGALLNGACLVLADEADRGSLTRLTRLMQREAVEIAELPPALMGLLDPSGLPDLRLVSTGGEAPPASLVEPWTVTGRRFVNGYGPTETTVAVTLAWCHGAQRDPLPIGLPMQNHGVYLVDSAGGLVGPQEPGELAVSGAGVARGYLGQPSYTATRFVPDPYSGRPGERMYLTRDVVARRPDGNLVWLGRLDRQVKMRGQRLEPAEIERACQEYLGVGQVAVEFDSGNGGCLVAWISGGSSADEASLRAFLGRRLPRYAVPTRLIWMDALPVGSRGKVDRAVLRRSIGFKDRMEVCRTMADTQVEVFRVVKNEEDQYSIWPADRELPNGWAPVGEPGDRETCLAHIEREWTDMRPRSVRESMAEEAERARRDGG